MTGLLLHTLVWTGVLIGVVLVLRRPVTRAFGPEAAYALWVLPLARLVLPPVTLPAWMAPPQNAPAAAPSDPAPAAEAAEAVVWPVAADAPAAPVAAPVGTAPSAGFDLFAALSDVPIAEVLLSVWLAGAAVTLWLRFAAYFRLRGELLADAREVGRAPALMGKLRLVETPATAAPLAMGVMDPVIALPPGFMALPDRTARDLALAHELAHHRGLDLLVNVLVQPLFALHWFNPLGRYGWLALRRDQEAACDARVMALRSPQERAAYAALIARFAALPDAGSHAALTAPMACPVLGEKSIIHRLRSLAMSDLSPRRRLAGRALLGAGLLALPLTASISYAASEIVPEVPEVPAPPAAPVEPEAPEAPLPPEAHEPPMVALLDGAETDSDTVVTEQVWRNADGTEKRVRMVFRSPEQQMEVERILEGSHKMDKAEREALMADVRAHLAEAQQTLADTPRLVSEALAEAEASRKLMPRVMVLKECTDAFEGQAQVLNARNGKQTIMICQPRMPVTARLGLEQARAEIARDKAIPEDTRKQLLETLDSQIARWKEREG